MNKIKKENLQTTQTVIKPKCITYDANKAACPKSVSPIMFNSGKVCDKPLSVQNIHHIQERARISLTGNVVYLWGVAGSPGSRYEMKDV